MSRRDRAVVADLMPDEKAIRDYFEAKGLQVLPLWVQRDIQSYWNRFPDNRIPILAIRQIRTELEQHPERLDLLEVFTRLVSYCEIYDQLPRYVEQLNQIPDSTIGNLNRLAVALNRQIHQLARKYSLEFYYNLSQPIPPLEPWEKLPPTK